MKRGCRWGAELFPAIAQQELQAVGTKLRPWRTDMLTMQDPDDLDPAIAHPRFADWTRDTNEMTRVFLAASRIPDMINLAGGLPASEVFPAEEIADIAARGIREHATSVLGYGPVEGLPELRDAIAARFSTPDLRLARENVLVVTSGMQGLDLIGKTLLNIGDRMVGQFPTYLGALDTWRPREPEFVNMDLQDPALDVAGIFKGAKFVYTVPNFSNPTGIQVETPMREALVDAAHQTGTWLVEDDPYGTLCYVDEMPPRLIDLSARYQASGIYEGPVLYMGTMSKELAPGLRIGWVIAAPGMIEGLVKAKQGSDMCTSGVTQLIALGALEEGLTEKIHPRVIALYRERRDALCAAMDRHVSKWLEWEVPVGGMFVWARARDQRLNTDKLLDYAMERKVCISPSSVFDSAGEHRSAMRINFTHNPAEKLEEGIGRLADALAAMEADGF